MIDNIGLYRMFYEVACHGSISEAAQKLYITQPAVSASVKQLESALSTSLFFRTNRGIKLTPEGELLFEHVKVAIEALEAGEDKLREVSGLTSGVLRVGASDMTLRFFLLDYIEKFNHDFPHIKLTVTNNPTPQSIVALLSGDIDFCVISEPFEHSPDIEYIPVREIEDIVITASDKYDGKTIDFEELVGETLIMLEQGTSTRRYIESQLKENGAPESFLEPDIELATSDLIIDFVRRGIGCAFVVSDFAKEYLKNGAIHEIKLKKPFKSRNFVLAYLKKNHMNVAAKQFIGSLNIDTSYIK